MKAGYRPRWQRGITLIELMVAVAIIGVLASIAYPMYDEQVRQSRRAEATAALVQLAQFMERFYTVNHRYDGVVLPFNEVPIEGEDDPEDEPPENKYYDLTVTDLEPVPANTYTLEAAPKGKMDGDYCGTLTLTHTGARGQAESAVADRCWR